MKRSIHFFKYDIKYSFFLILFIVSCFWAPNFIMAQDIKLPIYVVSKDSLAPLLNLPKGRSKITACIKIKSASQLLIDSSSLELFGFRKRRVGCTKKFTVQNITASKSHIVPLDSIVVAFQPYLIANCEIKVKELKNAIQSKIQKDSGYAIYFIPAIKSIGANALEYQLIFEAYIVANNLQPFSEKTFLSLINTTTLVGTFNPSPPSKPADYRR